MTHVFINKQNPVRIKMIKARDMGQAIIALKRRLDNDRFYSGELLDYRFGYYI